MGLTGRSLRLSSLALCGFGLEFRAEAIGAGGVLAGFWICG